jgi:hypothetical protein
VVRDILVQRRRRARAAAARVHRAYGAVRRVHSFFPYNVTDARRYRGRDATRDLFLCFHLFSLATFSRHLFSDTFSQTPFLATFSQPPFLATFSRHLFSPPFLGHLFSDTLFPTILKVQTNLKL